jgi:hypothetical protein
MTREVLPVRLPNNGFFRMLFRSGARKRTQVKLRSLARRRVESGHMVEAHVKKDGRRVIPIHKSRVDTGVPDTFVFSESSESVFRGHTVTGRRVGSVCDTESSVLKDFFVGPVSVAEDEVGFDIRVFNEDLIALVHDLKTHIAFSDLEEGARNDVCNKLKDFLGGYLGVIKSSSGVEAAVLVDELRIVLAEVAGFLSKGLICDEETRCLIVSSLDMIKGAREIPSSVELIEFCLRRFQYFTCSSVWDTTVEHGVVSECGDTEDINAVFPIGKLGSVFDNVVSNAVKYVPSGGQVVLFIDGMESGYFAFRVANTGPSIPSEVASTIFDYGTSHDARGFSTGLGLAGVRRDLKKYFDGDISLMDFTPLESGVCFEVKLCVGVRSFSMASIDESDLRLPEVVGSSDVAPISEVSDSVAALPELFRVLVVDDSGMSCRLAVRTVTRKMEAREIKGEADSVSDMSAVRDVFASKEYDVVVLDLNLGSGIPFDGVDLFVEFVQIRPEAKYYFATDLSLVLSRIDEVLGRTDLPALVRDRLQMIKDDHSWVILKQELAAAANSFLPSGSPT